MKKLLIILLVVCLIVFFGTWPLSILATIFNFIGKGFSWLASALNVFGWNGLV
jgi:hypothetical protein